MTVLDQDLARAVAAWSAQDPDPGTRGEVAGLLERGPHVRDQLVDRLSRRHGGERQRADQRPAEARARGAPGGGAELLDAERDGTSVDVGGSVVRFLPGGPQGRPELHAELLT